ncbi:MAG: integrase core domain-containing protein [Fidelibacterota bacterium]
MPWKEQNVVDVRRAFVDDYLEDKMSFTSLCECYQISTKTGYKWRNRFYEGGYPALIDMSRRPNSHAKALCEEEICAVIKLKNRFLDYGPKKIHVLYNRAHEKSISLSSVERIFNKAGYTQKRRRRKIQTLMHKDQILEAAAPNDIWTIDFKGHWHGRGGNKCEPFTVVDQYTRYILYCLPIGKGDTEHVKAVFIRLFKDFGLPKVIKSDNGAPFAHGSSPRGMTRLSNWLMSLGIGIHRIPPAKPSKNGKHERMHRDLKRIVQNGPRLSLKEYSAALRTFQYEYNEQRPHESLNMMFPAELYRKSERIYQQPSKDIIYPDELVVRKVNQHGLVRYQGDIFMISNTLSGYLVGLQEQEDNMISVYFCDQYLGDIDREIKQFLPNQRSLQTGINHE